ncbi:putative GprK-type G-protein coupled receptor protein [Aspergillus sclerotiicarbonarius CBS 121057]|uniref:Putative GprK-type G-protein coupled receptor protein n=1 Tax=Aspergillus sclerotiicarbonarius (strain CBS 121057 / IBT 28362) TaxID=1448318 RepID=A0A319DUY2_ASPSB|nr:putative GprK-type G-protein coupled receptor protein [Aspergillus sclerotiicarbonarius CBS 121057]
MDHSFTCRNGILLVQPSRPMLRVRGLPLSFSAILLLHVYWILGQISYPVGMTMPAVLAYDIQYFGMGIYFPLGIALFQASNLRFLHVAKMQREPFAHPELRTNQRGNNSDTSWLGRLRNMDYMKRAFIFIGIGMVVQFILSVGMWLACAKYHPTYGIRGTELHGSTLPEQVLELGRGWEWWPTMLWQVIWTWIAAPILIWKAWGIRDTMGWRTQTIACCICSLHATPMFLIASYAPAFYKVNAYFTPSQWIHVSILMFEIFTVFVPIYEVVKLWIMSKKTTDSMTKCNSSSSSIAFQRSGSVAKSNLSSTIAEKGQVIEVLDEAASDRLYTMDALEQTLDTSSNQIQEFAALCDFSGENIAFLSEVAKWKSSWPETLDINNEEQMIGAFNHALRIYAAFISTHDAEFPLNISSQSLKHMESIFEKPARTLFGEKTVNHATPFDEPSTSSFNNTLDIQANYTGEIPAVFNMAILDAIEDHVKILVLTNTWPKFVEAMRRRRSIDSQDTDFSAESGTTFRSWISDKREKLQSVFKKPPSSRGSEE